MRTALAADQQFGQRIFGAVFALFAFGELVRNYSLCRPPRHFFLNSVKILMRYYRFVMVLYKVHRKFSVVLTSFLGNAVGHICFLQKCVARVFFVR